MCFHVCVTPPVEVSPKEARHTSMQTRAFWNGVIISLSRKRLYTQFWLTGGVMQRDCRRHIKWPSKVQEFAEELRDTKTKKRIVDTFFSCHIFTEKALRTYHVRTY
jgi:hypothetical protein